MHNQRDVKYLHSVISFEISHFNGSSAVTVDNYVELSVSRRVSLKVNESVKNKIMNL